jgi:hypothetical protein
LDVGIKIPRENIHGQEYAETGAKLRNYFPDLRTREKSPREKVENPPGFV